MTATRKLANRSCLFVTALFWNFVLGACSFCAKRSPNIIFIVADDPGCGDIGAFDLVIGFEDERPASMELIGAPKIIGPMEKLMREQYTPLELFPFPALDRKPG